nr:outer membrane beta-barrel protein [uncultured Steroidobacter sp.]
MSKRTGLAVVVGLVLSLASTASFAEGGGWYFGVTGGEAKASDLDKATLDELVLASFESQGVQVLSGRSTLDDSDTSFSLFGGYRFSEYFALEAGYVDFGTAEYRASGVIDIGNLPAAYSVDFEVKGFTATAIGSVPLGPSFDLHGRGGILFADTKITEAASIATSAARDSFSETSQEFFYGLGVGLHLGQHWLFSLDWQQFKDVGDEQETGESDVNRLSLGVTYKL